MKDFLKIKGAREHNLKGIDLVIPRNKFVVFTGLSGSGKSSLAFDTIYAEGQRRYVESLTSYARQFLGQMEKPDVESIEGLSPAISIDQKTTARNPRSTVGTVTEVYDYLRLLFARTGIPHCPVCGVEISPMSVDQIVEQIMEFAEGSKLEILAPVVRGRKGTYVKQLQDYGKQGFVRCRVDGELYEISDVPELDKNKKHNIEIVVDRVVLNKEERGRIAGSVEAALRLTDSLVMVHVLDSGETTLFNTSFACTDHGQGIAEMEPRMFSFNAPYGACPDCDGLGAYSYVDEKLIVPDESKSIAECALTVLNKNNDDTYYGSIINGILKYCGASQNTPYRDLPEKAKQMIMHGTGDVKIKFSFDSRFSGYREVDRSFEGLIPNLERRYKESYSDAMRTYIEGFMSVNECPSCRGARLRPEVLAVTVGGKNIYEVSTMSVLRLISFFENLNYDDSRQFITEQIVREILARLSFLKNVGLEYLTLARSSGTLSGGEAQRIRLATQIGSKLVGVMYILDEPSIGLHQKDNQKLIDALRELTEIGNTLIVVEHDEDTIRQADYIVDLGPGAGELGGELVVAGTLDEVCAETRSVTGQFLSGARRIEVPQKRRIAEDGRCITIRGASENNLKSVDISIPVGVFTAVTGVSGSGKSTLINEILYKEAMIRINGSKMRAGKSKGVEGLEHIDKIIEIDQSPIGRTPRSNPAT
ncbi:MAG: excinuclease ABC subunit UvrA, partial [Bacillota bacterium]|nr:excinuclease ABC subunit UvrA [Bacillota bacterium]